jgi:hypothetical protein
VTLLAPDARTGDRGGTRAELELVNPLLWSDMEPQFGGNGGG